MSETELLRRFRAMPVAERKKFLREVGALGQRSATRKPPARKVQWPDVEARAKLVGGDRVLPNLVLAERDESAT